VSLPALVTVIAVSQALALVLLARTFRGLRPGSTADQQTRSG
jgi:hypothetical protein